MCSRGGIIQSSEDPRRAAFLNKVADDLVIEVFDLRPLDLLTDIFFLLSFQSQLDEDLLQLFVDVVDAELFEGIFLGCRFSVALRLNISALPRRFQIRRYPAECLEMTSGKEYA